MKKYLKQNVYYFKNVNEQYLHICGINLSINASQIVWIALKDHKKLFYCFFYLFGPNHKVQLVLYLSSKLRESFPYFSQRSLSYLFLLKGSWQKYQNYNSTLKLGEEKLADYLFLTRRELVPRGHKPLLVFSLSTFFQRAEGQENSSSILYARQKKQKILLTFSTIL